MLLAHYRLVGIRTNVNEICWRRVHMCQPTIVIFKCLVGAWKSSGP